MASPQKPASLWSFISGLLWGAGGGVGFMIWLLFKLLRFQHGEVSSNEGIHVFSNTIAGTLRSPYVGEAPLMQPAQQPNPQAP